MSEAPVLEMSKDSIRSGGSGRPVMVWRRARVWSARSVSVVARSTSSKALRWAMAKSSAFSPRWGTWTQTRWPARRERASLSSSQSPESAGTRISRGRMGRGR